MSASPSADTPPSEALCPGCGLGMPRSATAVYSGYFNTSPECWGVFTEVIGAEFGNAPLFGQVHQLTVDAYAVQHAGGPHPDKSVDVHLAGLHLVLECGHRPTRVPPLLQRLAGAVTEWPHFPPPAAHWRTTVLEVALADSPQGHAERVGRWATEVWDAWAEHRGAVAAFVEAHLESRR